MKKIIFIFLSFTLFLFANEDTKKYPIAIFDTSKGIVKIEIKKKIDEDRSSDWLPLIN